MGERTDAAQPVADGSDRRRPRVLILGGGFGGLAAAKALAGAPVSVTLLDRRNHHLFQPLLYQVATASLNASDIARPIREVLQRQDNAEVLLAEARDIDLESRTVRLADGGELGYDYLIVAAGAAHSYFGHDEWEVHAPSLKSIEDALDVRRRLLIAFENAERELDPAAREAWLNFVIVGGGPTGVELAGSLAEMAHHALKGEFRHIDPATARVILVEGLDRVLPTFPPKLSARARRDLETMGVDVRTGIRVSSIDDKGVDADGGRIEARTVLWAAGVRASPIGASLGVPLDRTGRVPVRPDLSVPGHPEVFVVGDLAAKEQDGQPLPGVAQAAMQGGRHAASAVVASLDRRAPEPFRYKDKGMLAAIGRAEAVADLPHVDLWGFPAWLIWVFVHIYFLIGFRNRVLVMTQWALAFFTHDRGARLITGAPASRGRWTEPQR